MVYEYTQRYLQGQVDKNENPRWWPFYVWNIKSSSRAQDGLYKFDAIARLRDAQLVGNTARLTRGRTHNLSKRINDPKQYRTFGPLGEVLRPKKDLDSWQQACRPVLLIDEIDKADSDFANDLLNELDEMRFDIPETEECGLSPVLERDGKRTTIAPIVFITSNKEKPLPEAFLRRCLYYYVPFPGEDILREIVKQRFGKAVAEEKDDLVSEAIARFKEIHGLLAGKPGCRAPGTSEFLEFVGVLLRRENISDAIAAVQNLKEQLPLLGVLLKTKVDQDLYRGVEDEAE